MRTLPSLNGLRVFEAAGRHMSFTLAAEDLCITQGAVSRAIRSLEDELGVPLFKRFARHLEFTEEGRRLWISVHDAIGLLERAAQQISPSNGVRVLTVNVLPTFATKWLMPRLVDFNNKHPNIEVRMTTSIRPVDFSREDIDVAIRVGHPDGTVPPKGSPRIDLSMVEKLEDVQMEKLLPDELVPVAAPGLVEQNQLSNAADLLNYTLLHNSTRHEAWHDWLKSINGPGLQSTKNVHFGHFFLTIQAAIQGQGIALIPRILVEEDLAAGRLVTVHSASVPSAGSYYLLSRKSNWSSPKVRVFREWLRDAISVQQLTDQP
jgi:LysR family glycine cleavage system transcriptional activator